MTLRDASAAVDAAVKRSGRWPPGQVPAAVKAATDAWWRVLAEGVEARELADPDSRRSVWERQKQERERGAA